MKEPEGYVDEIVRAEKQGKGTMFVYQAERSEAERAATGKASRTLASGSRGGPEGANRK